MAQPEFPESSPTPAPNERSAQGEENASQEGSPGEERPNFLMAWYDALSHLGLGESLSRVITGAIFLFLVFAIVWIFRAFYKEASAAPAPDSAPAALRGAEASAMDGALAASVLPVASLDLALGASGVRRFANLHTVIPDRPRNEITYYEVVEGDTVIGIAEKYGLRPQTVLWGNYTTLRDDPHNLRPGQQLNILPVDGTYYEWQAGDGLNAVSSFFGVQPEVIINYPTNQIDAASIGDYANPNIEPGTWLIVPGGTRPFISWSAPSGVTRTDPASAGVLGAGACPPITGGAVGTGTFYWPTNNHWLSGFGYSPETNHLGIDLDGETGDPVYAADAGVIVYAGWNDWGYGNMVIVDHGSDWQTLYAHLSAINYVCGQSVGPGTVIGAMGSTGNSTGSHLHFELMHSRFSKVNPMNYLPPP
jgi:murein DD-endopeptidase MepM/ murein hydrolase activator NlpD